MAAPELDFTYNLPNWQDVMALGRAAEVEVQVAGRSDDRRIRTSLARLHQAQKPGVGVPAYTRWVNRGLARYVAAVACRLGLSPNAVSFVGFAVSMSALALFVLDPFDRMVTGALTAALLAIGFVLDSADGQLARLTGQAGPAGEWLDHVFDAVRSPAVHLAILTVALSRDGRADWLPLVAAAFTLLQAGQFASQMLAGMLLDRKNGPRSAPRPGQSWALLPTDTGVMCWIFVLWVWSPGFELVYLCTFVASLALALASMRRRFRELSCVS